MVKNLKPRQQGCIVPMIVLMSLLGIGMAVFVKNQYTFTIISVLFAFFLAFGSGAFVPLKGIDMVNIPKFIMYSPITLSVESMQSLIQNLYFSFYPSLIITFLSILLLFLLIVLSHKKFRS